MNRAQLLFTKNQAEEIKKLAKKQGISQSELVRRLLDQSLGVARHQPTVSSGDWVCSLNEFGEENPRVQGFKEIYSVGGKHPEIRIITDATFRYYLANGTLPPGLDYRLLELGNQLKELSRTQKLVLRRAYQVPGIQNPPGPRFLGVDPADIAAALVELYKFAIEHKYYEPEGARIVAFMYPFADPEPLQLPISASIDLPYGGYAIPVNKDASRVEVLATWGNNEGVQSFEAIDRCTVDADKQIIIEKNIPQKNVMLATTMDEQSAKIEVPLHKQFEQILSDMEILEAARIVRELTQKYGLRRIEFSYDGRSGLEYNESIPYQLNEAPMHQFEQTARIKIIYTEKDVQTVKKLKKSEVAKTILLIDSSIVENRSYDVLNSVASLPQKFTVFYPGLAATAHAMRVLTDFGHTAIVVGSRKYEDREQVLVKVDADQQINIQRLSIADRSSAVVGLYDARLYGIEKVGGKAFNLSILKTKGFNVPHGFVLTTEVFDQVVTENFTQKMRKSLRDTGAKNIAEVEELGRNLVKFPQKLWQELSVLVELKEGESFAVRSSATLEDQAEHSFAGQFETFLNVTTEQLPEKVLAVMASTFSKRVVQYAQAMDINALAKMAVVVQDMVDVQKAGVVFGKDIQTGNEDLIVIDAARGLGEGVVDGTVKTERIVYSKRKDSLVSRSAGEVQGVVNDNELNALVEMSHSIAGLMGGPQDIEWAIDKKGVLWLLQTRDI